MKGWAWYDIIGFCIFMNLLIVLSFYLNNKTNARLDKLEKAITCVQQPQEHHYFDTLETRYTQYAKPETSFVSSYDKYIRRCVFTYWKLK